MWEYSPVSEQQWESLSQAELSWAWCVGAAACEHSTSTSSSYLNVYYRFLHWITHTTAHSDLQNVNTSSFVIVLLLTWMVEVMVGTMEVAGEETMLESWEGLMTAGAVNIVRITNWLCFDYCYCLTWQRSEFCLHSVMLSLAFTSVSDHTCSDLGCLWSVMWWRDVLHVDTEDWLNTECRSRRQQHGGAPRHHTSNSWPHTTAGATSPLPHSSSCHPCKIWFPPSQSHYHHHLKVYF